ncbi:MAG: response regulator, partial [Chitinophagales bacterium]
VVAIDDDIDVLTLIKKYLEPEGYQVVEALSGLDGIRLIKKLQPFAVTLDIMMPEFDGWETLYKIKCDDEIKNTPVIVISIIRNPELGFALGATEYLTKPFQRDDLIQKIGLLKKPHADTTVLVVDDDPDFCEIVEKMLGVEFNTLKAQSGEEALGILNFFLPDIILVDLMMPEMDGFQLITHVRSQFSVNIPLIVVSAKDITDAERTYLNEQFVDKVVRKGGLRKEEFVASIKDSLVFLRDLQS